MSRYSKQVDFITDDYNVTFDGDHLDLDEVVEKLNAYNLKIQKLEKALEVARECIEFSIEKLDKAVQPREHHIDWEDFSKTEELQSLEKLEQTEKQIEEILGSEDE